MLVSIHHSLGETVQSSQKKLHSLGKLHDHAKENLSKHPSFWSFTCEPDVNVTATVAYVIAASIPQYSQMLVFIRLSGLKMVAVCTKFARTS